MLTQKNLKKKILKLKLLGILAGRLGKEALYWNDITDKTALNLIMVAMWNLLADQV